MKAQRTIIIALMMTIVATQFVFSQESGQNQSAAMLHPFVNTDNSVPEGYSISFAAAYPIYAKRPLPMSGRVSVGLSSVLQLQYSNEGTIANIVGIAQPLDGWAAKLQILPSRQLFPSVSLWVRGTIGWQKELLFASDVAPTNPRLTSQGLNGMRYEFASTSAGIATESRLSDILLLSCAIGVQEIRSRDLWIFIAPAPVMGNGYHGLGTDRWFALDASASTSVQVFQELALVGEVSMLPYFNVILPAPKLEVDRAYVAILGARYALPIPLYVDTYARWQSSVNEVAFTQFRVGLSGQLSFK